MATDFSIKEAACISLGIEPSDDIDDPRVRSIERLLHEAYLRSRMSCESILAQNEVDRSNGVEESCPKYCVDTFEECRALPSRELRKTFGGALQHPETQVLVPIELDTMRFERDDLKEFFNECEFVPDVLLFDTIFKSEKGAETAQSIENEIDPTDFPYELHAANIAFRAITKGHGNSAATFKNRLIDYLEKNFTDLTNEAVQRIATVANPDKSTGRKNPNKNGTGIKNQLP
jgi:hypothetical protein